jgi:hypothetical protein
MEELEDDFHRRMALLIWTRRNPYGPVPEELAGLAVDTLFTPFNNRPQARKDFDAETTRLKDELRAKYVAARDELKARKERLAMEPVKGIGPDLGKTAADRDKLIKQWKEEAKEEAYYQEYFAPFSNRQLVERAESYGILPYNATTDEKLRSTVNRALYAVLARRILEGKLNSDFTDLDGTRKARLQDLQTAVLGGALGGATVRQGRSTQNQLEANPGFTPAELLGKVVTIAGGIAGGAAKVIVDPQGKVTPPPPGKLVDPDPRDKQGRPIPGQFGFPDELFRRNPADP